MPSANDVIALYTILASTRVSASLTDVVAGAISTDGESWTPMKPAVFRGSDHNLDKPSNSMLGSTAAIALLDFFPSDTALRPVIGLSVSTDAGFT